MSEPFDQRVWGTYLSVLPVIATITAVNDGFLEGVLGLVVGLVIALVWWLLRRRKWEETT